MLKSSSKILLMFKGLVLAMLSGAFYSLAAVMVKYIKSIEPNQLVLYRFLAIFAFSMPNAVKSGENLIGLPGFRLLLFLRGLFGSTCVLFSYYAFRYLPIGDASVVIFSFPVFVIIAARIFLKEKIGVLQSLTVLLSVIGIIFITKVPLLLHEKRVIDKTCLIGYLCAVGSMLFNTAAFIIMRKVKKVHHSVTNFTSSLVAVVETAIVVVAFGHFEQNHCGVERLYAILLGFFSYVAQTFVTMALQFEQAGPVSSARAAIDIILGYLWQTFAFNEIPDALSISGAVLVVMAIILLGMEKIVQTLPRESSYFKYMKWMTL